MNNIKKYKLTDAKKVLQDEWGHKDFTKEQKKIVGDILKGNDTFNVLPTSGGKSICFQIPAYLYKGTTVVISPLISLMKDQVNNLKEKNIKAEYVNSTLTPDEKREIYREVFKGEVDLLYISPELFTNDGFVDFIKEIYIPMIVIDESHTISHSKNFRDSFNKIGESIKELNKQQNEIFKHKKKKEGDIQIATFTATANKDTEQEIKENIDYKPIVNRFNKKRDNLYILTHHCIDMKEKYKKLFKILRTTKKIKGSKIIFCTSVKEVKEINQILGKSKLSLKTGVYHGKLSSDRRKQVQNGFINNKYDILIATNSFGLGVDKPDIRMIIHLGIPLNIEQYAQEIGRAGRDGKNSLCVMLYNNSDINVSKFLIRQNKEDINKRLSDFENMQDFAKNSKNYLEDLQEYLDS